MPTPRCPLVQLWAEPIRSPQETILQLDVLSTPIEKRVVLDVGDISVRVLETHEESQYKEALSRLARLYFQALGSELIASHLVHDDRSLPSEVKLRRDLSESIDLYIGYCQGEPIDDLLRVSRATDDRDLRRHVKGVANVLGLPPPRRPKRHQNWN